MTEGRCTDCGADSVISCTCKRFTHSDVLREKALAHAALIADNEKLAARLYSAVLLLGPQNNTCGMYQEAAKKWEALEKENKNLKDHADWCKLVFTLTPYEMCQKYRFQQCTQCDHFECGDCRNPAKALTTHNTELRNALSDAIPYAQHAFALKKFNHVCGDPNSTCDSDCDHDARVSAFLNRAHALLKEKV